jgi:glycosyltransferase involved in cell wall biosynthesis
MDPLISVIMPCFNSAQTLPWALASLLAQTYENWECIFVDDGSTDGSSDCIRQVPDPRFRCFRNPVNQGRGAARQRGLDEARGKYVCMLDADDWFYPCKLLQQVSLMGQEPSLVLVSTGMAVVDTHNDILGVRCRGNNKNAPAFCSSSGKPGIPVVPFAASMIRADAARRTGFDPAFAAVEDMDFLMRLLFNQRYGILPTVTYAYAESVTRHKVLQAHRLIRSIHRKYVSRYPVSNCVGMLTSFAKSAIYALGFSMGQGDWLVRRRSRPPTRMEAAEFRRARAVVAAKADDLFGSPVPAGRELQSSAEMSAARVDNWRQNAD